MQRIPGPGKISSVWLEFSCENIYVQFRVERSHGCKAVFDCTRNWTTSNPNNRFLLLLDSASLNEKSRLNILTEEITYHKSWWEGKKVAYIYTIRMSFLFATSFPIFHPVYPYCIKCSCCDMAHTDNNYSTIGETIILEGTGKLYRVNPVWSIM